MKSKEEEIVEHLPRTSFDKYQNIDRSKDGGFNGCGFVFIPLGVFIGIIYLIFG